MGRGSRPPASENGSVRVIVSKLSNISIIREILLDLEID